MKKKILALLLLCLLPLSAAYAATTYYGYVLPVVGGSQNTWGSLLNTIFTAIDLDIWTATGGTTIGVNQPAAGSSNITLTNPMNNYQALGFTTTGKHVSLPAMNAPESPVVGGTLTFYNSGSTPYEITAADGSTAVVTTLNASQSVQITALTNSTTNGTFQVLGPYLTSVSGNVSLGTGVSVANPANGSASNTGLYTTSTGNTGVTILGTGVDLWTAAGESVTGTVSTSKAYEFSATSAAPAAGTPGIYSSATGALDMSTTGASALHVTTSGSIGIGTTAPTSLLTVGGTFSTTGIATLDGVAYPSAAGTSGQFLQTNGTNAAVFASTRTPVFFGSGGVGGTAGNTYFMGSSCLGANAAFCPIFSPIAGKLKNLIVSLTSPPGTGNTVTATVFLGGSPGSETCTISGSASFCSDVTHTDAISFGSPAFTVELVWSASAASSTPIVAVEFDNP